MSLQNWDLDDENPTETQSTKATPLKKKNRKSKGLDVQAEPVENSVAEKENAVDSSVKKKKRKSKGSVDVESKKPKETNSPVKGTVTPKSLKKKSKPASEETPIDKPAKTEKKTPKSAKAKFSISADLAEDPIIAPGEKQESPAPEEEATEKPKKPKLSAMKRKSLKYKERKKKEKLNKLRSTMPKEKFEEYLNSETSGEDPKVAALNYLRLWKEFRSTWKFSKVRQTWLLRHWFSTEMLDKERFAVLLEYMSGLKGHARETTNREATELLEKHKDSCEDESKTITRRATQILQMLD